MNKAKKAERDAFVRSQFHELVMPLVCEFIKGSGVYHYAPGPSLRMALSLIEKGHFKQLELTFSLLKGEGQDVKQAVHEAHKKARAAWKKGDKHGAEENI